MNGLPRICSFAVDHDRLMPGIYVSRVDGDAVTYDLRMRRPNSGDYISPRALHSFEHMLATYMRSGELGGKVLYVGPMGCRTGFYLIVRQNADEDAESLNAAVLEALVAALRGIIAHRGAVPGAHRRECGNYRCLSLADAQAEARRYLEVLSVPRHGFAYESKADGGI